jgi:hypothetical protein
MMEWISSTGKEYHDHLRQEHKLVAVASVLQNDSYLQACALCHSGDTFDGYSEGNNSFFSPLAQWVVPPCTNSTISIKGDKLR